MVPLMQTILQDLVTEFQHPPDIIDRTGLQNQSIVRHLISQSPDQEGQILAWLARRCSLPFLESLDSDPALSYHLAESIPANLATRFTVLPVGREGDHLNVATSDPFDIQQRSAIQKAVDGPISWTLAPHPLIARGIQNLYGVGAETFDELIATREDDDSIDLLEEENIIDDSDDDASVLKFVNQIIREAVQQRATDIHLEPLKDDLQIRYRIDGVLKNVPVPQRIKALQASVIARLKVMAQLDIAEKRLPQDGRIRLKSQGRDLDVRVATIPCVEGENVSLRLLGKEDFTLDRLGMLPAVRQNVDSLLECPNGIILVTGPTGCGKSTSLYCFLSRLNTQETRIVTIEDPVENKLKGVMQIAVKPEIDLTFANGLRSILRGDPNVIMVGEIRDLETAEISIRAALTGHLVLSTLHTNDAIGGISRLTDMGVEPFLVGTAVRAFMAQRLVRRLCEHCKVPAILNESQLEELQLKNHEQVYEPLSGGCDQCGHTGYHGRIAIYEVCMITPEIQNLIAEGASSSQIHETAVRQGFTTMRQYGLEKVKSGDTSLAEVLAVTE